MKRALVLFTRDLRVRDQPALAAAAREAEQLVPMFVLDRKLLARSCGAPNRLAFLLDCLRDLDHSLRERGAQLVVRHGDVVEETLRLAHEWDLDTICMSADVTPYARLREQLLARACGEARIELLTFAGVSVVPAGELTPGGGDHYRVFTPYWRAWSQSVDSRRGELQPRPRAVSRSPRKIDLPDGLRPAPIPRLASLTAASPSPNLQRGGETAARKQLERWLRADAAGYDAFHDDLAGDATSRLAAHLHFGCLSADKLLRRGRARGAAVGFARQLCWRDFHQQVLAARPDIPHADYRPRGDRWRRSERDADAWRVGVTGYPIVDAGMRQLADEGFMHNRARLIVASFLTKTMYIDWRLGAAHFASLLADADVANNVGNWQWVAGTGNDTRPNRVLNPLRQAQRFDPSGDYVRRYVPELADVPGAAVHRPWLLERSRRRALRYPPQLLDHADASVRLRARRGAASTTDVTPPA
jgi:deoxyribodipyrimidine photo-lyase